MDWVFWYINMAANNVYFLLPLGFLLWLLHRLFKLIFPYGKFLAIPMVFIGIIVLCFIMAFPGYYYELSKTKEMKNYPFVKSHVLGMRGSIYNPITWYRMQPTGYTFVRPTQLNFPIDHRNYKFGADLNTFLVQVSTFDYQTNKENKTNFQYAAQCSENLYSISAPDDKGFLRWIEFNKPMGPLDIKIYCDTDYTPEFNSLVCSSKILADNNISVPTDAEIINASRNCS